MGWMLSSVFEHVDLFADGIGRFNVWRGSRVKMGAEVRERAVERTHTYYKMLRGALMGSRGRAEGWAADGIDHEERKRRSRKRRGATTGEEGGGDGESAVKRKKRKKALREGGEG